MQRVDENHINITQSDTNLLLIDEEPHNDQIEIADEKNGCLYMAEEIGVIANRIKHLTLDRIQFAEFIKAVYESSLKNVPEIYDDTCKSINALAITSAPIEIMEAYPALYKRVNRAGTLTGLGFVVGQSLLTVAAKRNLWKAKNIDHYAQAVTTGANSFMFGLKMYIAVYLTVLDMIYHIGSNQVDVSNEAFFLKFVLVTAVFSAVHAALEASKHKWLSATTKLAKMGRFTLQAADAVNNASNLNALAVLGLAAFGISEVGDVNPYVRFGLFGNVFLAGVILQILTNFGSTWKKNIGRVVDTASVGAFFAGIFAKPARQEFSASELWAAALTFAGVGIISVMCVKFTSNSNEQPRRNLMEEGVSSPVDRSEYIEITDPASSHDRPTITINTSP